MEWRDREVYFGHRTTRTRTWWWLSSGVPMWAFVSSPRIRELSPLPMLTVNRLSIAWYTEWETKGSLKVCLCLGSGRRKMIVLNLPVLLSYRSRNKDTPHEIGDRTYDVPSIKSSSNQHRSVRNKTRYLSYTTCDVI